jgi:hypothetical protein
MAATVQGRLGTGSSVSWANAEGGIKFNLEDTILGTTPVPIPTSTGTNFSWLKNLGIYVTATGSTTINNRNIYMSGSPTTGLKLHWKDVPIGSYAQAASGNRPTSSGSNGATPAGYTNMTTSPAQYDNTGVSTGSTGLNGDMAVCVMGVDNSFSGGGGNATSLPSIIIAYDEA